MTKVVNNPSFATENAAQDGGEKRVEVEAEIAELVNEQSAEAQEEVQLAPQEGEKGEVESVSEKIKIGEAEYAPEELQVIVEKGLKHKAWEEKMPGFDVDKLMPDYTRKSQRLAEYERRYAPKQSEITSDELAELGVDDSQIKAFDKVAKHLGFVRQTDLVQDSVEAQKDAFILRYPEYKPGSPDADSKWQQLMGRFSLYNWQAHPHKVEEMLEDAHLKVSSSWNEVGRGGKVREAIVTQKAKAQAAVAGGGAGRSETVRTSTNTELASKYRAMGWSEEDINEILT